MKALNRRHRIAWNSLNQRRIHWKNRRRGNRRWRSYYSIRRRKPMPKNVTQKLIESHLLEGDMTPGQEIALKIDQTLTQDATGTMVMLELEAMELDRAQTEVSVQYVDHNLLETDFKNADDHLFLQSAC